MLTARMLNGMDYAIGCTIATRRAEIDAIGGLQEVQPYLSEDFVLGNRMHASGRTVILSRSVIEHYIGNDPLRTVWKHSLRWARGSRRSRPFGYIGEIFTQANSACGCSLDSRAGVGNAGSVGSGDAPDAGLDCRRAGSRGPRRAEAMVVVTGGRCRRLCDVDTWFLRQQTGVARTQAGYPSRRHYSHKFVRWAGGFACQIIFSVLR